MALLRLLQSSPSLRSPAEHHLVHGLRLLLASSCSNAVQDRSIAHDPISKWAAEHRRRTGPSLQDSQKVLQDEGQLGPAGSPLVCDGISDRRAARSSSDTAVRGQVCWAPTLPPTTESARHSQCCQLASEKRPRFWWAPTESAHQDRCCQLSSVNQPNEAGGLKEEALRLCAYAPFVRTFKFNGSRLPFTSPRGIPHLRAYNSFGAQSRTFRSSSHHASWFSPSRQPSSLPPDESVIKEVDPSFVQEPLAEDRGLEPEVEFDDLWPKVEVTSEGLGKAPSEVSQSGSSWSVWDVFAPISGGIVVALDGVHSFTGMPWWLTIVATTAFMRCALVPLVLLQIKKTGQLSNIFMEVVKASPPGTSFMTQLQKFTVARQAMNGPSPMWVVAAPCVQIPLFVSASLALRQMAAEGYSGFDTGGLLWFTDLTLPAGIGSEAAIFPVLAIGLYLTNVQLAFGSLTKRNRFFRVYKGALQALAVPAFVGSFYLPQAMLLYWVTNNFCSFAQNMAFRSNSARTALGLPRVVGPAVQEIGVPITDELIEKMDANQLVDIAATCEAQKRTEEAIKFLKKAHVKAPEEASIFYALGQTHAVLKKWEEAAEYQAQAAVHAQDDELRGKALYGLGIAHFNQAKLEAAVEAMREAADLRPDFLEGQLSLASLLSRTGSKTEALEVLQKAARLEPKIQKYIDILEQELGTQADAANRAKGKR